MIFASKNAFNMKTQSRRDDLISLCYFLLYLVDGDLTFLQNDDEEDQNQQEEFSRIKKMKNMLTPEMLCAESDEGKRLQPFLEDIFKLDYEQTPNYDKLRFTLVKGLLNLNETPNKEFDWNVEYLKSKKVEQASHNSEDEGMSSTDEGIMSNEDSVMADRNASRKMDEMQGYQFCHKMNHCAMQKIEGDVHDITTSPICKGEMKEALMNGGFS